MTDTTGKTRADLTHETGMIPVLYGAQEADDQTNDGDAPDDQDATADETTPDDQANDDSDADDGDDDTDVPELKARLAEAEADAARYKRRLLASDLRKKTLERELNDARRKQAPAPKDDDPQKRTPDPDDATTRELADLRRQVQDSKVRAAFTSYGKHQWQDADAAWRLLDLSEVRNDDGTVDPADVHDAADALAKANPWLVKTVKAKTLPERPSGQQPGATRRDRDNTDKDALARKFPALRGRY